MRERKIRQITRTITRLEQHIDSVPTKLTQGELKQLLSISNRITKCRDKLLQKRVPDVITLDEPASFGLTNP
jgi:hypothetical protein